MQYQLLPNDEFILARLSGLVSAAAWDQALAELERALGEAEADRLMLDLTGLVGWLGLPERTAVGALMARRFARMKKVALFIQAHKITGVVEAEARRLGLDLRLFPTAMAARAWVLE